MALATVERVRRGVEVDRLWSADITYIWTLEGWLFLSHVEDLFSRRIVGWEMQDHMRKELVIAALVMAVGQRKPEAGCIHHSDKGSQFTAVLFGERCARAGITPSTGSKGDCFDNACSESFHATLKKELIYRHTWATRAQARTAIFEYRVAHIPTGATPVRAHPLGVTTR